MDLNVEVLSAIDTVTTLQKKEIVDFLERYLGAYADPYDDMMNCVEYALSDRPHQGGMVLVGRIKGKVVTCLVMNKTGMSGYMPENILVYIATHEDFRRQGLGSETLKKALVRAKGDISLHLIPGNPAKEAFNKLGFKTVYHEMQLLRG